MVEFLLLKVMCMKKKVSIIMFVFVQLCSTFPTSAQIERKVKPGTYDNIVEIKISTDLMCLIKIDDQIMDTLDDMGTGKFKLKKGLKVILTATLMERDRGMIMPLSRADIVEYGAMRFSQRLTVDVSTQKQPILLNFQDSYYDFIAYKRNKVLEDKQQVDAQKAEQTQRLREQAERDKQAKEDALTNAISDYQYTYQRAPNCGEEIITPKIDEIRILDPRSLKNCDRCGGSGKVQTEQTCDVCYGSMKVDCPNCSDGTLTCYSCNGTGLQRCSCVRYIRILDLYKYDPYCRICGGSNGSQGIVRCGICNGNRITTCTYCGGIQYVKCQNCTGGKVTEEKCCSFCKSAGFVLK